MTGIPSTPSFWQRFGPNHLEALCLGVIGGAFVAGRVGLGILAGAAALTAVVSYGVRHFVKV